MRLNRRPHFVVRAAEGYMRKILFGAALLGMLAIGQPAFAQGFDAGDLELNPFFGLSWHSSNQFEVSFPQSSPAQTKKFKFDNAFRAGMRFNIINARH